MSRWLVGMGVQKPDPPDPVADIVVSTTMAVEVLRTTQRTATLIAPEHALVVVNGDAVPVTAHTKWVP